MDIDPATLRAALATQRELAARVRRVDDLAAPVRLIAGVDVSMARGATVAHAAIVVMDALTLRIQDIAAAAAPLSWPYVPGLLSFRELPVVRAAWARLRLQPDLVMVDGHGVAHPRGLGIASHVGVSMDVPTIGCAKSILVGVHAPLGPERGDRQPLMHKGLVVGWALRTKARVAPVYVACGHRVSHETALQWVLATGRGYRLPEPTRQAHLAANEARRAG